MSQRSAISGRKSVMNPIDYSGVVQSRMLAPTTGSTVPKPAPETVTPISSDLLSPYTGEGGGESVGISTPEQSATDQMSGSVLSQAYSPQDIGMVGYRALSGGPLGLMDAAIGARMTQSNITEQREIEDARQGKMFSDLFAPETKARAEEVAAEMRGTPKLGSYYAGRGIVNAAKGLFSGEEPETPTSVFHGQTIDEELGYEQQETTLGIPTFEADPTLDIGVNTYSGTDAGSAADTSSDYGGYGFGGYAEAIGFGGFSPDTSLGLGGEDIGGDFGGYGMSDADAIGGFD